MSHNKQATISPRNLPSEIGELYVFGDLLSDTGNLFEITSEAFGTGFPSAPFFEGRYSNGRLWIESLASELGIAYNFDTNFALIGATTGLDNVGNPFEPNDVVEQLELPGTLAQVNNFIASNPNVDPNGLYTIWAGIYDFGLGVTDTTELVNNIITSVENLANAGAKNVLVPNLPDLNRFPGTSDIAGIDNLEEIIEIFNSNLSQRLDELDQRLDYDVNIIQLDANSLFDRIFNNPTQFGFTNVTDRQIQITTVEYLLGGYGQDIFVLDFQGTAIIGDFHNDRDKIDLAGSLSFLELDIVQQGNDTAIRFGEAEIGRLLDFKATFLSANDFI